MLRKAALVLVVVLLLLPSTGCSNNITVKAAIVYKMGGAQAVARTTFYLSKEDLKSLAAKANISDISALGFQENFNLQLGKPSKLKEMVESQAISNATTDFEGNAKFESVPSGTYYIIGLAQTRGGIAIWNVKVDTNENTTIILDQNNAAYAS